ncbi:AraC family transcriptional regulator [Paenibacillus sp. IB182496]|uniref:AraC family transcriptional regulator n=1 Tax=Paenibacillus sabuli TaxID=2772509 RepID=A0A927GU48_9BACL|nr:AraC family transcriptional regulator [Paenibacillus sabuli]MBD2848549.1 AraC family transcriptional regulator [Paenibacillus sabuli]
MTTLAASQSEQINEERVVYQHPLLYLKVWEVRTGATEYRDDRYRPWHYHKEVELLTVTKGRLAVQTREDTYALGEGDVVLLGSKQLHRTRSLDGSPVSFIVLQIDLLQHFDSSTLPYAQCFSELTRPLGDLNYMFGDNSALRREIVSAIVRIYRESQDMRRGYELAVSAAIRELLLLLLRGDTRGLLQEDPGGELLRLRPVLDHVEAHLQDKIAVEDVCRLMNFSYHYFIRYFRSVMSVSFIEYVNYKRIKRAERLLLTRDLSISETAAAAGIPSMAQFYKLFRRYNRCSPKAFKQRMRASV